MENKNQTLIVILLTVIATTLVLGAIYFLVNLKNIAVSEVEDESQTTERIQETEDSNPTENLSEEPETQNNTAKYEAGSNFLVTQSVKPVKCSANGNECNQVMVTTEVDLTEPGDGTNLTGRLYIRAYKGGQKTKSAMIGEYQIKKNFNPFGQSSNTEADEIFTLAASKNEATAVFSPFESNFYLEYTDAVPGWEIPGYIIRLNPVGQNSDLNGRFVDFLYENGKLEISTPA